MNNYFGKLSPIHTLIEDCNENIENAIYHFDEKVYKLISKNIWTNEEIQYLASLHNRLNLPLFAFLNGDIKEEELPLLYSSNNDIWIKHINKHKLSKQIIENIIIYCDENVYTKILPINLDTFITAIKKEKIDIMKWIKFNSNIFTFETGIEYDNYFFEEKDVEKLSWKGLVILEAVNTSNLDIIKWMKEEGCYIKSSLLMRLAAKNGNLNIMKWLKENDCPWGSYTFSVAVENGNMNNLIWLKEQGCPWDYSTYYGAIKRNNLDIIKWLKKEGCPLHKYLYIDAINNLDIMKWLKENNCPLYFNLYNYAIYENSLDIITWLKENGCPNNEECILLKAIYKGNINIVIYLVANNFPLYKSELETFIYTIRCGNLDIIKWLKYKFNLSVKSPYLYKYGIESKKVEVLEWLKTNKCPIPSTSNYDIRDFWEADFYYRTPETHEWLIQNGFFNDINCTCILI